MRTQRDGKSIEISPDFSSQQTRVKDDDDDVEDHHERVEKECECEVSQIVLLAFARFSRL